MAKEMKQGELFNTTPEDAFDTAVNGDGVPAEDANVNEEAEVTNTSMAVFTDTPQFDASDITPPVLRLAQGLTPEVQDGLAKPGQWLLVGRPPMDSVTIVPMLFAKRRELREEMDVLCVSDDSIVGHGNPGGICKDCPMNKWTGEKDNRQGPRCTFYYSYIVFVDEHKTAALLNFKRTSVGIGKMLNSLIMRTGLKHTVVTLTSTKASGKKGAYYVAKITPVADVEAKQIAANATTTP